MHSFLVLVTTLLATLAVSAQQVAFKTAKEYSIEIIAVHGGLGNTPDCSSHIEAGFKKIQDQSGVSGYALGGRRRLSVTGDMCYWWCPANGYYENCSYMSGFVCGSMPSPRRDCNSCRDNRQLRSEESAQSVTETCAHNKAVVALGLTDVANNDDSISSECRLYLIHGLDFVCHVGED